MTPMTTTTTISQEPPAVANSAIRCRLCGTAEAYVTPQSLAAGAEWRCRRCGQRWDGKRLATVTAYETWRIAKGLV